MSTNPDQDNLFSPPSETDPSTTPDADPQLDSEAPAEPGETEPGRKSEQAEASGAIAADPSESSADTSSKISAEQAMQLTAPTPLVRRLNPRAVAVVLGVIGLMIALILILAAPDRRLAQQDDSWKANPMLRGKDSMLDAGPLSGLPDDYTYPPPPPKPAPRNPPAKPPVTPPVNPPVTPPANRAPDPASRRSTPPSIPSPPQPPLPTTPQVVTEPGPDPALLRRLEQLRQEIQQASDSPLVFEGLRSRQATRAAPTRPLRSVDLGPRRVPDVDQSRRGRNPGFAPKVAPGVAPGGSSDLVFLENAADGPVRIHERLAPPRSAYELQAGAVIPASLVTAIHSDLPGDVIAHVTDNVYDSVSGRHLLIPQGARLLGKYNSQLRRGQNRILVAWRRLILPNGKSIGLHGMPGVDAAGAAGLYDRVDYHLDRVAGATLLSSTIAFTGNLAREAAGDQRAYAAVGDTIAQQAAALGQRIVERELDAKPTVTVRAGWPFNVLVNQDLNLEPYQPPSFDP